MRFIIASYNTVALEIIGVNSPCPRVAPSDSGLFTAIISSAPGCKFVAIKPTYLIVVFFCIIIETQLSWPSATITTLPVATSLTLPLPMPCAKMSAITSP